MLGEDTSLLALLESLFEDASELDDIIVLRECVSPPSLSCCCTYSYGAYTG